MAKPPNPFAGITLTDQTPMRQPGHDQRLFSSRSAAPASEEEAAPPTKTRGPASPKVTRPRARTKPTTTPQPAASETDIYTDTVVSRHHETTTPRAHETTASRWQDDWVAATARALRRPGKESATLRLTSAEKTQLRDVAYTYTRQGRRTTETDLIRMAIHALLEDYQTNGEVSALVRVMAALEP